MQPLIDRIAAKLPAWKGKLLDKAGRLTLVRSVLTSMPIYFLYVLLAKMDSQKDRQIEKGFLVEGL